MTDNQPNPAFLKELGSRIHDLEKEAKGQALWEIIQEEVGSELDKRFIEAGKLANNTITAVMHAEKSESNMLIQTVTYRMGLTVNGKPLEAVMTISDKAAMMDGRWAVMDALKASLAEQIAGLLLSGLQFIRGA